MQTKALLLILLSAIVALALVLFQNYYKTKKRGNLVILRSFLRFLALFAIFILLVNPEFTKQVYSLEKPNIVLLVDNSSSVKSSKNTILRILDSFKKSTAITEQFTLDQYSFGTSLHNYDSLTFEAKNTNITAALASLNEVYGNTNTAIVLITDGNQTLGADYGFYGKDQKFPIYPIVIGDTTRYEDVRIDQVNANRYAFLKNKFPLEVYVSYEGEGSVESRVSISVDGKNKHRETVKLSKSDNIAIIKVLLDASSVGVKSIKVAVSPLENEKNKANNSKNVVIEVIDEKTNIAIISNIMHPDIGALVKAIESNEQHSVFIKKPSLGSKGLEKVDIFIFYQPDPSFRTLYGLIDKSNTNLLTITGTQTDWGFLNAIQSRYRIEGNYPVQETVGIVDPAFSKFDISEFYFADYPPLESDARVIEVQREVDVLLNMQIKGINMNSPLIFTVEEDESKEVIIFGENLWKWRMQSYRDNQDFNNFDGFIGKLIVYLSDNKSKDRLNVDYESIYEEHNQAKLRATYFDEAFVFDSNADILIKVKGKTNSLAKEIPMLLKSNYYEADIADLPSGDYSFTVTVKNKNHSKSGGFSILDFDVEKQLLSSNYKKLGLLASHTAGEVFYPSAIDSFIKKITNENRFIPIQTSAKNVVSLIDFRVLLAIIVAALGAEWFIRKYNGLI
ncbi:MAG: VWA domain-containing protein [Flavobacteriaceae bacterium]